MPVILIPFLMIQNNAHWSNGHGIWQIGWFSIETLADITGILPGARTARKSPCKCGIPGVPAHPSIELEP